MEEETSLVVQQLGVHAPDAEGLRSILGKVTGTHMLQLRPSVAEQISQWIN